MDEPVKAGATWQVRAFDRPMHEAEAQERALRTSERFLDAANRLLHETGRIDFRLQEVVERSGQSIRSFYQHFSGKDELLLALFEEAMRRFTADLRNAVDKQHEPIDRLEAYVRRFHHLVQASEGAGPRALGVYHLHLAQDRPEDFAAAMAPQITLLAEVVDEAVAASQIRSDIEPAALVLLLTHELMSAGQLHALGIHLNGAEISEDALWAWVKASLTPPRS